jgi:hypothetical protein
MDAALLEGKGMDKADTPHPLQVLFHQAAPLAEQGSQIAGRAYATDAPSAKGAE